MYVTLPNKYRPEIDCVKRITFTNIWNNLTGYCQRLKNEKISLWELWEDTYTVIKAIGEKC